MNVVFLGLLVTFPGFMSVAVFCHRPKQIYRKLLKEKRDEEEKR
jgi:hypothetical protein